MNEAPKYEDLTEHQKKSLPATNYWRERNGQPLIEVPLSDTHYYEYFKKTINQ